MSEVYKKHFVAPCLVLLSEFCEVGTEVLRARVRSTRRWLSRATVHDGGPERPMDQNSGTPTSNLLVYRNQLILNATLLYYYIILQPTSLLI